MSVTRRIFPEGFKREAVDRVASSGLSAGRVAAELGLHETVLRRWMARRDAGGGDVTLPARSGGAVFTSLNHIREGHRRRSQHLND